MLLVIGSHTYSLSEYIGKATNNIAEYTALIRGLQEAKRHGAYSVEIRTDSELMVKQIKRQYKVKSENLLHLYEQVISLLKQFKDYTITHIPREKNADADNLAKNAIKNRGQNTENRRQTFIYK